MSKQALIERVLSDHADILTTRTAESVVESLFQAFRDMLRDEGMLTIRGIGTYRVAQTKARTGRNPQTGEPLKIPAGIRIGFKAATPLKDAVTPAKKPTKRKAA